MARKRGTLTNIGRALQGAERGVQALGEGALQRARFKMEAEKSIADLRSSRAAATVAETEATEYTSPAAVKARATTREMAPTVAQTELAAARERAKSASTANRASSFELGQAQQNAPLERRRLAAEVDLAETEALQALRIKPEAGRAPTGAETELQTFRGALSDMGKGYFGQGLIQEAFRSGAGDPKTIIATAAEKGADYFRKNPDRLPDGMTAEAAGITLAMDAWEEHGQTTLTEPEKMSVLQALRTMITPISWGESGPLEAQLQAIGVLGRGTAGLIGKGLGAATDAVAESARPDPTAYGGFRFSFGKKDAARYTAGQALDEGDIEGLVSVLEGGSL